MSFLTSSVRILQISTPHGRVSSGNLLVMENRMVVDCMDELDCASKCRSVQHGDLIYAIGTKGSDSEVINLWMRTCQNYPRVKDRFGRSAIHVSATMGRAKVVLWLVNNHGVNINSRERLSGYTPLHLSIFFGHIHVAKILIQYGARLNSLDYEGLSPLGLFLQDRPPYSLPKDDTHIDSEVWVWGHNKNYTLGIGKEGERTLPGLIEFVPRLTDKGFVLLQSFHSVFGQGEKGTVWVAGTGPRLGVRSMSAVTPTPVRFGSHELRCIAAASGPDHTVFLMRNGSVWTCGSNENFVLGIKLDPAAGGFLSQPRRIEGLRTKKMLFVAASQFHSVFGTVDELFVCGVNAGQLGISRLNPGEPVLLPETITDACWPRTIQHLGCNSYATAISYKNSKVTILYKNQRHRLNLNHLSLASILKTEVIGGRWIPFDSRLAEKVNETETKSLKIVILIGGDPHQVLVYKMNEAKEKQSPCVLRRVVFSVGRPITVRDIATHKFGILIVTDAGEAFHGSWESSSSEESNPVEPAVEPSSIWNDSTWNITRKMRIAMSRLAILTSHGRQQMPIENLKMRRIPFIHRGWKASCSENGSSFAVIQFRFGNYSGPSTSLNMSDSCSSCSLRDSVLGLFNDTTLEDSLHDIEFNVETRVFPAHRYIISERSEYLNELVEAALLEMKEPSLPVRVEITGLSAEIFYNVLSIIYGTSCVEVEQLKNSDDIEEQKTYSRFIKWRETVFSGSKSPEIMNFSCQHRQDLCDLKLCCSDGLEILAHRCMLACRLTYFKIMFGGSIWHESVASSPTVSIPFPAATVSWLLRFIYEDDTKETREEMGISMERLEIDSLMQIIQMCDMYQCQCLQTSAEHFLANLLTLRNVAEILTFSQMFNCTALEKFCIDFSLDNLPYLLENRLLDPLEDDLVLKLSTRYSASQSDKILYRKIRPYAEAPSDDIYKTAKSPISTNDLDLYIQHSNVVETESVIAHKKKSSKLGTKPRTNSQTLDDTHSDPFSETPPASFSESGNSCTLTKYENEKSAEWQKVRIRRRSHKFSDSDAVPEHIPVLIEPNTLLHIQPPQHRQTFLPVDIPSQVQTHETDIHGRRTQKQNFEPKFENFDFPDLGSETIPLTSPNSVPSAMKKPILGVESGNKARKKRKNWIPLNETCRNEMEPEPVNTSWTPQNPWRKKCSPELREPDRVEFHEILAEEESKLENTIFLRGKSLESVQVEELAMTQLVAKYTTQDVIDGIEILEVRRSGEHRVCMDPVWNCEKSKSGATPQSLEQVEGAVGYSAQKSISSNFPGLK